MSGKIFAGVNNKATLPKKVYVGINNTAREVKAAYVGVNGVAQKIWPNFVLPIEYHQIEYIGLSRRGTNAFNGLVVRDDRVSRILMNFKIINKSTTENGTLLSAQNTNASNHLDYFTTNFEFILGPESQRTRIYSNYNEGILLNKLYTVDFNYLSDGTSYYYLYCEDGYYSIASHNLLGSVSNSIIGTQGEYFISLFANYSSMVYYYPIILCDNSGGSSGTVIHEFIPCYKGTRENYTDVGVYDIVDRIFYRVSPPSYVNIDIALGPDVE